MHLIINRRGVFVHARSETLEQRLDGKLVSRVALRDLRSVVVLGESINLSTAALARCARFGVPVHVLSSTGTPLVRVASPHLVGTAATRRAQHTATPGREVAIGVWLVRSRLRNNVATAKYYAKHRRDDVELAARLEALDDLSRRRAEDLSGHPCESMATSREWLLGVEGELGVA